MFMGIDLSHWQGTPDFARVKAAGIRYVMVKATEGTGYVDPCFKVNLSAAIAAGLPAGAYHFLRSGDVSAQAKAFLAAVKPYRLAWPAAVDVEASELTSLGRDKLTEQVLDFCAQVKAAGYQPMAYGSYNWFYVSKYLDVSRIRAAGIPVWMAWYGSAAPENTDRSALCDVWQYASDGSVKGVAGKADLDAAYRDFGAPASACDTSGTVELAAEGCYTAKTTGRVNLVAGTPGIVQIVRCIQNSYTLWHIVPVGRPGQDVGIYAEGAAPRLFRVVLR